MSRLNARQSLVLLGVAVVAMFGWALTGEQSPPISLSQAKTWGAEGAKLVQVEITIEDAETGLSLHAKRRMPIGSTALEAMQATVAIETKEFQGLGLFVTSLCGVKPPPGKFWSPAVDGEKSPLGIARIEFKQDARLDWTLKDAQSK